jgi:hypothetical protein
MFAQENGACATVSYLLVQAFQDVSPVQNDEVYLPFALSSAYLSSLAR